MDKCKQEDNEANGKAFKRMPWETNGNGMVGEKICIRRQGWRGKEKVSA